MDNVIAMGNQYNVSGLHIDPAVFQHPTDRAITEKIRNSNAFGKIFSLISKHGMEHVIYSFYLSSCARLTQKNAPGLIRMCEEASGMFGLSTPPELFLERSYDMSGKIRCINKPVILLSTEMISSLSERGTWGAIAACACGARSGYTEIDMIDWASGTLAQMNLAPASAVNQLAGLIAQWKKVAQLTFDRATLLATGDLNTAMEVVLGGEIPTEALRRIDFTDPNCGYMKQCRAFAANQGKVNSTLRMAEAVGGGDALSATRYIELFQFWQGEYQDLMEAYAG